MNTKKPFGTNQRALNNVAATYSPGCNPSTIGAAGLNFSVRDGKRWDPCARPPKSLWHIPLNILSSLSCVSRISYFILHTSDFINMSS